MTGQLQEVDRDTWLDEWLAEEPDGTLPRLVRQLRSDLAVAMHRVPAAEVGPRPKYHIPGPYEIALAVGAALAASGRYETPGGAMAAAWASIPEFYFGRDMYLKEIAPAAFGQSPPEGGA